MYQTILQKLSPSASVWPHLHTYKLTTTCSSFCLGAYCLTFVAFSHSVVSNSLQPHGLWHSRLPCPSLSPTVCSNSCPLSRQCHPTISSSVVPFSSHLQSFPPSGFYLMSRCFTSGGQSIGASASASVLPMNIQG